METVEIEVTLSLKVLADDNGRPMDAISPEVKTPTDVHKGPRSDRTTFLAVLSRGERLHADARARVHPAWTTRWEVAVVRSEPEPQ